MADADTITLPDYILDRNEQATSAGLSIEKQVVRDGKLTTWYRGTEAQWRAAFRPKRRKPFPSKVGADAGYCWRYGPLASIGVAFRLVTIELGTYRGSCTEPLPEWIDDVGDEITAFGCAGRVVYVGAEDVLIARGIAPPDIKSEEWGRADGEDIFHMGPVIWEYRRLHDGRGWFCDYVAEREEVVRRKAERHKHELTTPAAIALKWAAEAACFTKGLLRTYKRSENKAGAVFAITAASLEEINEAIQDLLDVIQAADIVVKDANPNASALQKRARIAKADPAFQAFMRGSLGS